MVMSSRNLFLMLGLGILVGVGPRFALAQIPPGFEVVRITKEAGSYRRLAINARGQVVFSQRIDNDFDLEEIFLWTPDPGDEGGTLTRITDDSVRDAFPDINDHGTIVWSRRVGPNRTFEMAMWRDGEITILTDNAFDESSPHVNNLDHVVWNQFTKQGCTESDIFFFNGETTTRITNDGFSNQGETMNDRDEIVWTRYNFCVGPWQAETMLYSGGKTTQLTTGGGQIQVPDINNQTVVVWGGEFGLERWIHGEREVLIAPGNNPSLNNAGFVSFSRQLEQDDLPQAWWFDGKEFYRLTEGPGWNAETAINALGETVWLSGPNVGDFNVMLMRRVANPRDMNLDGDIDLRDFAILQRCFDPDRSPSEDCEAADIDRSGSVDREDFRVFTTVFPGPT